MTSRGKVIVVANPKGGVGKSTVTSLIAATLKWSKKLESIHVVDADQQASTLRLLRRIEPSISCSHYPISYEYDKLNMIMLDQIISNARIRSNNVLLVDTPARPDQAGLNLFAKAHAVIVPVGDTLAELPTTSEFVKSMDGLKEQFNKIHPHIIVIPNKIHQNKKNLDSFFSYFENHDVVIGPPIHENVLVKKIYLEDSGEKGICKNALYNDMKSVSAFISEYILKEKLDEIYHLDSKGNNVATFPNTIRV